MQIEPGTGDVSVALPGSLNPAIFTPTRFVLHETLPKSTERQVVHAQLSVFPRNGFCFRPPPTAFRPVPGNGRPLVCTTLRYACSRNISLTLPSRQSASTAMSIFGCLLPPHGIESEGCWHQSSRGENGRRRSSWAANTGA